MSLHTIQIIEMVESTLKKVDMNNMPRVYEQLQTPKGREKIILDILEIMGQERISSDTALITLNERY